MTKVAPTLLEKCADLAHAYESELQEKDAEALDAARVVKRRQAELEALRKQVAELESAGGDVEDGGDEGMGRELRRLVEEARSALEVEQKAELRRLLSLTPALAGGNDDDEEEKVRLAVLLWRAQIERRELVRAVVAHLEVAGMSERQGVYKGLIAKALGEREEDVESMLPEILRELEEVKTQERAEGLEGSPL